MQDNWGGEEMSMTGHSNWEEEVEVEIGMWNNNPSQEVNQTGNWPYKKMTPKVIIKTSFSLAVLLNMSFTEFTVESNS